MEAQKWKRDARRMEKEVLVLRGQAGRLGQSLRDVSRGISRSGTARSVSRGRRRRRLEKNDGWVGEEVNREGIWDGVSGGNSRQEGHNGVRVTDTKDLPRLPDEESSTIRNDPISKRTEPDAIPGPSLSSLAFLAHPSMEALTQYLDAAIQHCSSSDLARQATRTNHLDLEASRRSNPEVHRAFPRKHQESYGYDDEESQRHSNMELNRISTWTHHLDLEPDDDDNNEHEHPQQTQNPIPTPLKPTHRRLTLFPPPSPYVFPRLSFPSFYLPPNHPSNIDPTPSSQSDANFLAANIAASDDVSDSSIVAALRRVRSREKVRAWRDGWMVESVGEGGREWLAC